MICFSADEKTFMAKYEIGESRIFDGRGMSKKECHDKAKAGGYDFYYAKPCMNGGHRIKTRSGHCAVCRPLNMTFQKRYNGGGALYVARSEKYTKVGVVDNVSNLDHREHCLNMYEGYGDTTGWEIIAWTHLEKNVGRSENKIHNALSKYSVKGITYNYGDGGRREAQELFSCSPQVTVAAIDNLLRPRWAKDDCYKKRSF